MNDAIKMNHITIKISKTVDSMKEEIITFIQSLVQTPSLPEEEKAGFEEILKKYVPKLYYLPYNENIGLDSIYTHDTAKITKRGAILLSMGKETRENEPPATKDYYSIIRDII
ncbi:MAG: hypothetical protein ACXADY_19640 [Candidatus Hodarchaeales archaeon]|jgi:hypothetical protein